MPEIELPIIDISSLFGNDEAAIAETAKRMGNVCRDIGFMYVKGHGLSDQDIDSVFKASAEFFALPVEQKKKALYSAKTGNRGYVPMKGEALDPSKPQDLKEVFNIGLELQADDPEILAGQKFRALNLWPDLPGFRETMLDYFERVSEIGRVMHKGFAHDLGVAPDYFTDQLDRPLATLRLLHYPERPDAMEDGQMGAGEHTDYGNITLLMTDEVGGLEVRSRDGNWIPAPHVPGAFVVNIGDCLMRWTNDVYVSTPHRVVSPKGVERYSVAFFLDPNPDAIIETLPTCIAENQPVKYPPIRGDDYLASKLDPTYKASGIA
ncbi:MAG: 2-oxoglutarate and iron-dependent oxygenase domain-containing protein [Pseudomonadota bacterium]